VVVGWADSGHRWRCGGVIRGSDLRRWCGGGLSGDTTLRGGRRRPWSAACGDFSPLLTDQEDKAGSGRTHEGNFAPLEREAWWVPFVGERISAGEWEV